MLGNTQTIMYSNNYQEVILIIAVRQKGENMEEMNEQELKKVAIEKYINIQRIKKHGQEEIEYQEKIAKAELQALGMPTEELELNK